MKDDARRLPSDEIVIVVNADMPIRAKRIQYYADRDLKLLFDAQDPATPLPLPTRIITKTNYDEIKTVEAVSQAIADIAAERVKQAPTDRPQASPGSRAGVRLRSAPRRQRHRRRGRPGRENQ